MAATQPSEKFVSEPEIGRPNGPRKSGFKGNLLMDWVAARGPPGASISAPPSQRLLRLLMVAARLRLKSVTSSSQGTRP
jgi:hypothetical protein